MSIVGLIALTACLSSVCAKLFFTVRMRTMERMHEKESSAYQASQNALHQALQQNKRLEAERKQIEARRNALERTVKVVENTLNELKKRKEEDDAIRAFQKSLIKGTKPT